MECLVTGAAGFIGSHLCEKLCRDGHRVVGVDCLTPYYPAEQKWRNLLELDEHRWFDFRRLDLAKDDLGDALKGIDWVFHLAATPGLTKSWTDFDDYNRNNITATQRLLNQVRQSGCERLVYASTSSVYGKYASGDETLPTQPCSPYGVTKLAAERLCQVYASEFGLPVVNLRYFSVYGPRQRPDMGYHKFINAALTERPLTVFGDGRQTRGNTYVTDAVAATIAAASTEPGETFNVGGGELVSVLDVIGLIEKIAGVQVNMMFSEARPGDQRHTGADVTKLRERLGWEPVVGIEEGLSRQIRWQTELVKEAKRREAA